MYLTLSFLIFQVAFAVSSVSEERLQQCYEKYPFFVEILFNLSDADFADPKKSLSRQKFMIRPAIKKDVSGVRSCLSDIRTYAWETFSPESEDRKYFSYRLGEIFSSLPPQSSSGEGQSVSPIAH